MLVITKKSISTVKQLIPFFTHQLAQNLAVVASVWLLLVHCTALEKAITKLPSYWTVGFSLLEPKLLK